jgi:hypothetical protein
MVVSDRSRVQLAIKPRFAGSLIQCRHERRNLHISSTPSSAGLAGQGNIVKLIAQSADELVAILRRGLSPLTNNRDALLALGFERAYPQVRTGHDSMIWERTIDHHRRPDGYRVLARERAYLVAATSEKQST